jgi:4,4'-diaponeurosporenoate glycosyltransferase
LVTATSAQADRDVPPAVTPLDVATFAVGWGAGWFLLWRVPRLPPVAPPVGPRRARSIVVPARDEANALPGLLASVMAQRAPGDEVVVVDDGSVDGTGTVAAACGATVLAAPPLPPGWTGKAWACWCGAQATTGPLLVFLDADVVLAPGALDRLDGAESSAPGALVSVQPWHAVVGARERLSLLFNITALMGSAACTTLGRRARTRVAFGPVLATSRSAYERAGGHGAPSVRGAVAEDIALARRYDRVEVFGGRDAASFRMYPRGIAAIVEGWTKNIAAGFGAIAWWFALAVVAWIWSLAGGPFVSPWFYAASAVQLWVLGRRAGRFGPVAAALYPVALVFFLAVFLRSLVLRWLRRPVAWRGRRIVAR